MNFKENIIEIFQFLFGLIGVATGITGFFVKNISEHGASFDLFVAFFWLIVGAVLVRRSILEFKKRRIP